MCSADGTGLHDTVCRRRAACCRQCRAADKGGQRRSSQHRGARVCGRRCPRRCCRRVLAAGEAILVAVARPRGGHLGLGHARVGFGFHAFGGRAEQAAGWLPAGALLEDAACRQGWARMHRGAGPRSVSADSCWVRRHAPRAHAHNFWPGRATRVPRERVACVGGVGGLGFVGEPDRIPRPRGCARRAHPFSAQYQLGHVDHVRTHHTALPSCTRALTHGKYMCRIKMAGGRPEAAGCACHEPQYLRTPLAPAGRRRLCTRPGSVPGSGRRRAAARKPRRGGRARGSWRRHSSAACWGTLGSGRGCPRSRSRSLRQRGRRRERREGQDGRPAAGAVRSRVCWKAPWLAALRRFCGPFAAEPGRFLRGLMAANSVLRGLS